MKIKEVVFLSPGEVKLRESLLDPGKVKPDEMVIDTHASIVSSGTELSILGGGESWAPLPFVPGYGAVGKVIARGSNVTRFKEGDMVFTYGKHASAGFTDILTLPLPQGLDPRHAVMARMAAVSITALRVSSAELGDYVAVYGMGLVGNLAAQLFLLAGCEVIAVDLSERRLRLASECGVRYVINGEENVRERIREITGGKMCSAVVEATGVPQVAEDAGARAAPLGELVLLGSPRRPYQTNLTGFLNQSHLFWPSGCHTILGAHEWRYPVHKDPAGRIRHSIERNVEILLSLIQKKKLTVDKLITQTVKPDECVRVYDGLKNRPDEFIGVVFDWR